MTNFNVLVGAKIGVQATPQDASNNPTTNLGNATCVGANDAIALKTNNSGDGEQTTIQGVAPGTVLFTQTGHKPDNTPVTTQFQVTVAPGPIDHFSFSQIPPF